MKLVLNLIWLILCGLWMFLAYMIVGAIWCITIIGIPFGTACFRIGLYALWPFGRTVVRKPSAGAASTVGNILWFILSGLWLAIGHIITGVLLCITIIGIPLGLANFKLIPVSLRLSGATSSRRPPCRAPRAVRTAVVHPMQRSHVDPRE